MSRFLQYVLAVLVAIAGLAYAPEFMDYVRAMPMFANSQGVVGQPIIELFIVLGLPIMPFLLVYTYHNQQTSN